MSRFERVAVVLSGGGALSAYQAGALSAMDAVGWQPNFIAATSTGVFNAAIVAGAPTGSAISGAASDRWRRRRHHVAWHPGWSAAPRRDPGPQRGR